MYKKLLALSLLATISTVSASEFSGKTGTGTAKDDEPSIPFTAGDLPPDTSSNSVVLNAGEPHVLLKDGNYSTLYDFVTNLAPKFSLHDGTIVEMCVPGGQEKPTLNSYVTGIAKAKFDENIKPVNDKIKKLAEQLNPKQDYVALLNAGLGYNVIAHTLGLVKPLATTLSPLVTNFSYVASFVTKAKEISILAKLGTATATSFNLYAGVPLCALAFGCKSVFDTCKQYNKLDDSKKNDFSKLKHFVSNLKTNAQSAIRNAPQVGLCIMAAGFVATLASQKQ